MKFQNVFKRIKASSHLLLALIVFTVAMAINGYFEARSILNSTSSTAAIGFLYLPLVVLIVSLPWLGVGLSLGFVQKALKSRLKKDVVLAGIGSLLSIMYVGYTVVEFQKQLELTEIVAKIQAMDAGQLNDFIKTSHYNNNKFALGAVCLNKNASANTLALIAAMKDPGLHEKMWSDPPIMGDNRKGLAVMRLVARHSNVTPDTLTALSKSPIAYVKSDVAGNKLTPVAVLEHLYESNKNSSDFYLIEWGLSHNPATPVAILEALAKSTNEWTRYYLKRNPSTPGHIKSRI